MGVDIIELARLEDFYHQNLETPILPFPDVGFLGREEEEMELLVTQV